MVMIDFTCDAHVRSKQGRGDDEVWPMGCNMRVQCFFDADGAMSGVDRCLTQERPLGQFRVVLHLAQAECWVAAEAKLEHRSLR